VSACNTPFWSCLQLVLVSHFSHHDSVRDLCGYGPFHSLLVILSLAATVLTWFISLDCRLFQITEVSQFDTTETQRYVGIWLNEENGSCQSYHQRDETRIDGFMVLVRTASLIGMFFSLIFWFATIVPCFTNIGGTPYMRQIAHFHVIMAVASACMLVRLFNYTLLDAASWILTL